MYKNKDENEIEIRHKELLALCSNYNSKLEFVDFYGLGFWLRKYANVPSWLPLYFHGDHGPSMAQKIAKFELDSKYTKALFHNRLKVKDALARKFKKVYIVGSGFVHCKTIQNIKRDRDLQGTVCFPYHSTICIDVEYDWDKYINDLKRLPEKFHPVTVCLHHIDIGKQLDKIFLKHGFEVVCAGHKQNIEFTENFYSIIKGQKYATSNAMGSQALYCAEFNLPFFLYGDGDINLNNKRDSSFKKGEMSLGEFIHTGREMSKFEEGKTLFGSFTEEVTDEQKSYAEEILGINDALSSKELRKILIIEFIFNMPSYFLERIYKKLSQLRQKMQIRTRLKKLLQK